MAENQNDVEKDIPEVLEESLSKTEIVLEENKKLITNVLVVVAVVFAGYFVLNNFIWEPAEQEAQNEIWEAQQGFEQAGVNYDSIAELFTDISSEYASTDAGNLSNLYAGISLMKVGSFEDAQSSLESFSAAGKLMPGLKLGLIGDCQSELGDTDAAVSSYKKAAKLLDSKNGSVYFLKKAGILLEQNGQAEDATEVYETALNTYLKDADKSFAPSKKEIEKYLARAQAAQ